MQLPLRYAASSKIANAGLNWIDLIAPQVLGKAGIHESCSLYCQLQIQSTTIHCILHTMRYLYRGVQMERVILYVVIADPQLLIYNEQKTGEVGDMADQAHNVHAHLMALITDYKDMQALQQQNPQITFTINRSQAPDLYKVTLHYTSYVELLPNEREPLKADIHRVEIFLGADYPHSAPTVTWLTPIFHPNIRQPDGAVRLGVLRERYLVGIGLARLARMLVDVIQWHNVDFSVEDAFNPEAAKWAVKAENWPYIEAIGGYSP